MLYGELPAITLEGGAEVNGVTFRVANPPKTAVLRLPTSAEMIERLDQQKSIRRSIGRRKSQTEFISNQKADLDLFLKVRLDKGPEFDEYEASKAISKLTSCEATECVRVGEAYQITLKTPFGETVHTVTIPTERSMWFYRRSIVASTDLPHGQEELRYRIEPAIQLYFEVASKVEGYATGFTKADVPPHHMSTVVAELANAVDDLDPVLDPNS